MAIHQVALQAVFLAKLLIVLYAALGVLGIHRKNKIQFLVFPKQFRTRLQAFIQRRVETLADIGKTILVELAEVEQQDATLIYIIQNFGIDFVAHVHDQVLVVLSQTVHDDIVEVLLIIMVEIQIQPVVWGKITGQCIVQVIFVRAEYIEQNQYVIDR